LGFTKGQDGSLQPSDDTKATYRHLHRAHRSAKRETTEKRVIHLLPKLRGFLANGDDVNPAAIDAELEEITGDSWQSSLFRFASLCWSVPVSSGYGRRMRFLVWDKQNGKLIGLIALGDPVFNMSARDIHLGWTSHDREERLVNVMDAFVLGAIPPYNRLLGGKLVASLIRTKEVVKRFNSKYGHTEGLISKKQKHAQLACVTTTSALGRSSIYNRLKLGGIEYFRRIGFTSGFGHFQIPDDLFEDIRAYLKRRRNKYHSGHQYGQGPNWRMRAVRRAFDYLGLNTNILRHNLKREIFICEVASNASDILQGKSIRPNYGTLLSVSEVTAAARERWMVPRSQRFIDYRICSRCGGFGRHNYRRGYRWDDP